MSEYSFAAQSLHIGVAKKLTPDEDVPENLTCRVRVLYNGTVLDQLTVTLDQLWDGGPSARYAGTVITAKDCPDLRAYLKQPVVLKLELEAPRYISSATRTRSSVTFKPAI